MAPQRAININGQTLPVREYQGQRVVTVQDVAMVHNTKEDQIRRNFNRNRKHFIEGVDYFNLKGEKARVNLSVASKFTTQINVFTESGYLMLAKSLTDDTAWQVQRELVNNYFKLKEIADNPVEFVKKVNEGNAVPIIRIFDLLEETYKKVIYYRLEKGLTQEETSKVLEISKGKLERMESNLRNAGMAMPRQNNNLAKYSLKNYKALAGGVK